MGLGIDSHPDQLIQFYLLHFWITTREKAPLKDKTYKVFTLMLETPAHLLKEYCQQMA